MNNGADLNTKIEELKQFALKSGNTFVVDMINSNKNRNDLFFENMSKMVGKGYYHGNPHNEHDESDKHNDKTENPLVKNEEEKNLVSRDKYVISNNYENINDFFSYKDVKNDNNIRYYNKNIIGKDSFVNYLVTNIAYLFNNKENFIYDFNFINILLNESSDKLKSEIEYTIITPHYKNSKLPKKLGDKLRSIVLNCENFIRLIYSIDINVIEINYVNENNTFYLSLLINEKSINIPLISHNNHMSTSSNTDESIITNALNNVKKYKIYSRYLSRVMIDGLLFLNSNNDNILDNLNFEDDEINKIIQNNTIQLAEFILTTCLFIGKANTKKDINEESKKK